MKYLFTSILSIVLFAAFMKYIQVHEDGNHLGTIPPVDAITSLEPEAIAELWNKEDIKSLSKLFTHDINLVIDDEHFQRKSKAYLGLKRFFISYPIRSFHWNPIPLQEENQWKAQYQSNDGIFNIRLDIRQDSLRHISITPRLNS